MVRILILLAAITLGGCVITPDYRYADGQGYYYGADEYDDSYVGHVMFSSGYPFMYGSASTAWGWPNYWGAGYWGAGWGGYWNSWGYLPPYYWTVHNPRYRDRDLGALNAEKVRYVGNRRGAYREAAMIAGARATQISRNQDIRQAIRRDAVRREVTRQSETWHRPWPRTAPAREVDRDVSRPQVTRPDMPRGMPERRPVPVALPDHGVARMPMAPTRSTAPARQVRSAPVVVPRAAPISRPSRSHNSSNSSVHRSAPRSSSRSSSRDRSSKDD